MRIVTIRNMCRTVRDANMVKTLAIVGTSKDLQVHETLRAMDVINRYIDEYHPWKIISGGASGIDTLAEIMANRRQIRFYPITPRGKGTKYNLARNREIAKSADMVLVITTKRIQDRMCYHHTPWQSHQKTAGCYTGKIAKQLNKDVYLELV